MMKLFRVSVKGTCSQDYFIEAENEDKAVEKVHEGEGTTLCEQPVYEAVLDPSEYPWPVNVVEDEFIIEAYGKETT